MLPNSKLIETTQRIGGLRSSRELKSTYKYIYWIITRYLHYVIDAVIHGYPIKIYHSNGVNAEMQLIYTPEQKRRMWRRQRKKYALSSRVFGNMFYLSITGRYFPGKYYEFYLDKGIKKRIEEILNTDAIYQFVK